MMDQMNGQLSNFQFHWTNKKKFEHSLSTKHCAYVLKQFIEFIYQCIPVSCDTHDDTDMHCGLLNIQDKNDNLFQLLHWQLLKKKTVLLRSEWK